MIRSIWKPALALGAVLAATGAARADDRDTHTLAGGANTGTTMTLGGKGTAAQAATEDTELTHGYRYRGYYGWGGGYGYRGYYGGYYGGYRNFYSGYRPYYGGYYNGFYRPYYNNFSSFSYYRPAFYSSYYTYPVYPTYYYNCGPSVGLYLGIGGGAGTGAPTVPLGGGFARPPAMTQPMPPPVAPGGTFPYDGGPANPVPLPKADPNAAPPTDPMTTATDLPISLKPKPPAPQYKYKAYGEK